MFGVADYGAFVVAVIIFLLIPGPGNLALALSTGKGGFMGGLAATFGVILGDQALLWLAVAGLAGILAASPHVFLAIQWAGAAYFLWLGIKMLTAKAGAMSPINIRPREYFQQAFVITIFNPKAIMFYMAFFTQFVDPATHRGLTTFVAMSATIALITLCYGLIAVSIVYFAADKLQSRPQIGQWFSRGAGALLVGFGLRLALTK